MGWVQETSTLMVACSESSSKRDEQGEQDKSGSPEMRPSRVDEIIGKVGEQVWTLEQESVNRLP